MHDPLSAASRSAVRTMISVELGRNEHARLMHRLDCVALFLEGRSFREIAEWFGVGKRSIQRWVHTADMKGVEGLLECHKGGRPRKLTCEQEQTIRRDLDGAPGLYGYPDLQWSGKRLVMHLARRHAIEMSVRTCQRMIAGSQADVAARRGFGGRR